MASFLAILLMSGTALACEPGDPMTGIPDLDQSLVTWGLGAGQSATLLVLPDGSGPSFTAALRPDGTAVDATVHVRLIDSCGDPIFNFPREDMWLDSANNGLTYCNGGAIADQNTDRDGRTQWTQPLRVGGSSQSLTYVVVNGSALPQVGLALHFVSPDLNGDLTVLLTDVPPFVAAYFGGYTFAADLHADGVLNLSDISVLVGAMGAACH